MYEFGTLRPPTDKEMRQRNVPLEHIDVLYWPTDENPDGPRVEAWGSTHSAGFTTAELIAFHQAHSIPFDALVVGEDYEGLLGLDWTHLDQCHECDGWHPAGEVEAHEASDYHKAVVMGRNAPPPILSDEQMRALGRPVPGGNEQACLGAPVCSRACCGPVVAAVDGLGPY